MLLSLDCLSLSACICDVAAIWALPGWHGRGVPFLLVLPDGGLLLDALGLVVVLRCTPDVLVG